MRCDTQEQGTDGTDSAAPMSINNTDRDEAGIERIDRRYAELDIGDGKLVIYDRENHQSWIQSSVAVSITDQC